MLLKMRKLRQRLNVTQAEIASFVGCTPQFISAVEREENVLSYDMARKISQYLGTEPDKLFLDEFKEKERQKRRIEKQRVFEESEKRRLAIKEKYHYD